MEISALFWLAIGAMLVIAVGFVGWPLLKDSRKSILLIVAIAVPISAAGMYAFLGSPDAKPSGHRSSPAATTEKPKEKIGSVASMVEGLAIRLRENPDDGGSWLLLARSYKHLNRIDEAIDAYQHAAALGQFDADLAALATPAAPADSGDSVARNASDKDAGAARIYGNVKLAAEASDVVQPTDTVFIFAKALNGPPAPLAVLQRPASELPIDFMLNDSQSMIEGMKLSNFEEVIVTARITRGSDATVALQGLEAKSDTVRIADNRHLDLTIQ
jgi:hypothetical protein